MWKIQIKKKVQKNLVKLPENIRKQFLALVQDLKSDGPIQPSWPNYSKLNKLEYHCHLNYHYVACWTADDQTITIEVYYVGSRENSPY